LGVDRLTDGGKRIARFGVPADAAARGRIRAASDESIAKMSATKRGVASARDRWLTKAIAARPRSEMVSEDLRQWRSVMLLSQHAAAPILGLSEFSLSNYERGSQRIPHALAYACSALYKFGASVGLPTSIKQWRADNKMTTILLGAKLGTASAHISGLGRGFSNTRKIYLLACVAIEHKLKPWHRLRKAHKIRLYP